MTAVLKRWGRDLLFHVAGLATSILGFTLWVTGVSVTLGLAITVVGLLSALAFFWCFRWFARLERHRAAIVLGAPIPERYRRGDPDASWFARLRAAAADPATWKDFTWTIVCGILGFALSVAVISLWGSVLCLISLPIWYWAPSPSPTFGIVDVDTLGKAFAAAGAGVLLIPVCGLLVRGLTRIELAAMVPLLCPPRGEELAAAPTRRAPACSASDVASRRSTGRCRPSRPRAAARRCTPSCRRVERRAQSPGVGVSTTTGMSRSVLAWYWS